jgi:arylsulfatase A-like enzyme
MIKRFKKSKYLASITGISLTLTSLSAQDRPNIVYIMCDDHAFQAISAYGGMLKDILPTPNIDRLAKEGMIFQQAFCTNSISVPSRAAILTGKYSHKNGVYTNADSIGNQNNVAHILQNVGYQTALMGKWHLATEPQGFDYYSVLPGQGLYHNPDFITIGNEVGNNFEFAKKEKIQGHSTDIITDKTLKWMKNRDNNKPFMIMCHFKAPHDPWQPAERFKNLLSDVVVPEPANLFDTYEGKGEYVTRLKTSLEHMQRRHLKTDLPKKLTRDEFRKWAYQIYIKDYLRCVAGVDENVGRILDFLDENNLTENTIVIYTSDQGFFLGEHGWYDKRMMYEETLRTPLIIRYPKEVKKGRFNKKDMVMTIDYAPTMLDYAGIPIEADMQGESLRPILSGKTPKDWRKAIYYRYWMHDDDIHHVPGQYGIRTDRYKLIYFYNKPLGMKRAGNKSYPPSWELYDLKKDPSEMVNLYDNPRYSRIKETMKKELRNLKAYYEDEDDLMDL